MLLFPDCWSLLAPANFCTNKQTKNKTPSRVRFLPSMFHEVHVLPDLSNLIEICSLTSLCWSFPYIYIKRQHKTLCLCISKPWFDCLWGFSSFQSHLAINLAKNLSMETVSNNTAWRVHEQHANLTRPGVRNVCDFWEFDLVLEFVVACCGPNVTMPVMYRGTGVSNVWIGGKQQESLRDSREAPPEWEEIIQSMNLWLEAASEQLLGNILQMQEISCALPESPWLGTDSCPHFCSSSHGRPIPCLCELAWQDQIAGTVLICCFLPKRGEKMSLKFSIKNNAFHSVPLMMWRNTSLQSPTQ